MGMPWLWNWGGKCPILLGLIPMVLPSPLRVALAFALPCLFGACSVEQFAINKLGDALAGSSTTFASEEDPELVREAVPFSLKLIESVLAESPRHEGLLLAATKGFTQYSFAFVQQDAERREEEDLRASEALMLRARSVRRTPRDRAQTRTRVRLVGVLDRWPNRAGELRAATQPLAPA